MSKLGEQVKNHSLKYSDIIIGETLFGNPEFNVELLDYLIDRDIRPREFWAEQNFDDNEIGVKQFYYNFYGAYSKRKSERKKHDRQ